MMADTNLGTDMVGERIAGRFIIERPIGAGRISTAFRARDELLARRVTVKLFHPVHDDDLAVVAMQLDLASAVARLSHPNIVTVIDRGEHDGHPFVVLEFVRGENLQERIDRYAPLPIDEVVRLGVAIARALGYAHAQGVAHGNIRPANVLVSEDREVKVVDFGGGSLLVGSDPYQPPELRGRSDAVRPEPTHDVYALGALLWSALTDEPIPRGGVASGTLHLLRPDASPRLAALVARCIANDPDARPESMQEIAAELSAHAPTGQARSGGAQSGAHAPPHAGAPAISRPTDRQRRQSAASDPEATGLIDQVPLQPLDSERSRRRTAAIETGDPPRRRQKSGAPTRGTGTRARLVAWGIVLVPLAALGVIGVLLAGERGTDQRATAGQHVEKRGPVEVVPVSEVAPFDPPPGDGSEHDDELEFLVDGDPETTWSTETYSDASINGKPGVGFILTLERPEDVRAVSITTKNDGWTAQIYLADLPGSKLSDWTKASPPTSVATGKPIEVDAKGRAYRSVLVWITRLSLTGEGHVAEADEVKVRAVR